MPTERYVNRADQSPPDARFVEAPTQDQIPVTDIVTGETVSREFFDEMIKFAPLVDKTLDNPVPQEVIKEKGLEPNEELLASFRALVGGEDFKVFRSQVIRAFKHLGLDTVKFFGE
jgi:hypothetical protein